MIFGGRFALLGVCHAATCPAAAAGAMRFFWDYHLGPSITSPLLRHPGLDFARITYRPTFRGASTTARIRASTGSPT